MSDPIIPSTPVSTPALSAPASTPSSIPAPSTSPSPSPQPTAKSPLLSMDEFDGDTPQPPAGFGSKLSSIKAPAKVEQPTPQEDENIEEGEVELEETAEDVGETNNEEVDPTPVEDDGDTVKLTEEEQKVIHGNNKRDFTGFDKDEIKLLKKLDNGRFLKVSQKWKELKEKAAEVETLKQQTTNLTKQLREGGIPETWSEHPEAYVLHPEYQKLSNDISRVDYEENFYRQQALRVKNGEEWQHITGYQQNGQPILSQAMKASNEADIWLNSIIGKAAHVKGGIEQQINNIQRNFQHQHQSATTEIKTQIDQFVSKLIDPLKPKAEDEATIDKVLPASFKSNPMTYGYKKMFAVLLQQARYIQTLQGQQAAKAKINNDNKLAGANISRTPRDPAAASGRQQVMKNGKRVDAILDIKDFIPKDE